MEFYLQKTYEELDIKEKFPLLIVCISNKNLSEEVRSMASVLLRRLFNSNFDDFFPSVSIYWFVKIYYYNEIYILLHSYLQKIRAKSKLSY